MGYNHYRFARRVDASTTGICKSGGDVILKVSRAGGTGSETTIKTENGSGILKLEANTLKFGTYNAITTETLAGYITIKDLSTGMDRKLAVIA